MGNSIIKNPTDTVPCFAKRTAWTLITTCTGMCSSSSKEACLSCHWSTKKPWTTFSAHTSHRQTTFSPFGSDRVQRPVLHITRDSSQVSPHESHTHTSPAARRCRTDKNRGMKFEIPPTLVSRLPLWSPHPWFQRQGEGDE